MKGLLLTFNLLVASDSISTHVALNKGAHEVLLSQRPWVNHALLGTMAVGTTWQMHNLHKKHPKLAKGLTIALISLKGAVVVNNIHQIRKLR